jgi:hypothetical protein
LQVGIDFITVPEVITEYVIHVSKPQRRVGFNYLLRSISQAVTKDDRVQADSRLSNVIGAVFLNADGERISNESR